MKKIFSLFTFFYFAITIVSAQRVENSNLSEYVWSHEHLDSVKPDKPTLDFDIIDNWISLGKTIVSISPDGQYIAYDVWKGQNTSYISEGPPDHIVVQAIDGSWKKNWKSEMAPEGGFFSSDSKQYIYLNEEGLCFLQLGSNETKCIKNCASYRVPFPVKAVSNVPNEWIAIASLEKELTLENLINGKQKKYLNVIDYEFDSRGQWLFCKLTGISNKLIVYNLKSEREYQFEEPLSYNLFSNDERLLLNRGNEFQVVDLANGKLATVWKSKDSSTQVMGLTFDASQQQLLFGVQSKDSLNGYPQNFVWYWKEGNEAKCVATATTAGLPSGFVLQSSAMFSDNGKYIILSLQQLADTRKAIDGAVKVKIWDFKDKYLQSGFEANSTSPVTVSALARISDGQIIYTRTDRSFSVSGDYVITYTHDNSDNDRYWEYPVPTIDLKNLISGENISITALNFHWMSADEKLYCYYVKNGSMWTYDVQNNKHTNQFIRIKDVEGAYWLPSAKKFLIFPMGQYDLWEVDPTGKTKAINVTNGYGKAHKIIFSFDEHMPEILDDIKDLSTIRLIAFGETNQFNGYFRATLGKASDPEKLYFGPCYMEGVMILNSHFEDMGLHPLKAANRDLWVVRKHTPEEGENYFFTKDFRTYHPITSFQPFKNVNWYTRELRHYKCMDGKDNFGILYKPENFDPHKKYPVIMPFYLGSSDLFIHQNPCYPPSVMHFSGHPAWLVSHGYVVFVPNIFHTPLKEAMDGYNILEGAARFLQTLPYVDGKHIGAATHSVSAKKGAYALTHSKLLAAMAINEGYTFGDLISMAFTPDDGAETGDQPVTKVSQLGEMESKMFQFGDPWKNKASWIDQTTVLNVDKAYMPLLLSCDPDLKRHRKYNDQTFEIFTALRRLNKPVWWFQYSTQDHNIKSVEEQKDYAIRLLQFFDHYLKGAPAPMWMTQGLPNKLMGIESRLDLDPKNSCGPNCPLCKAWNTQYKRKPEIFIKPLSEWSLDDDTQKKMDLDETKRFNEKMKKP